MIPTNDDYDELEIDAATHRTRRSTVHRPRHEKELTDGRRRRPRFSDKWVVDDWRDFNAWDYMEFDDDYEDSLNRHRYRT